MTPSMPTATTSTMATQSIIGHESRDVSSLQLSLPSLTKEVTAADLEAIFIPHERSPDDNQPLFERRNTLPLPKSFGSEQILSPPSSLLRPDFGSTPTGITGSLLRTTQNKTNSNSFGGPSGIGETPAPTMNSLSNSRFFTTVRSGSRPSQGGNDASGRNPLPFGPTGPTLKLDAMHVERTTKTYSNLVKDAATQFKRQIFDAVGGSDRNGKFNTPVPIHFDNGNTYDFEKKCNDKYREVCGQVWIKFQHTVYYRIVAVKPGRSQTTREYVEMDDIRSESSKWCVFRLKVFKVAKNAILFGQIHKGDGKNIPSKESLTRDFGGLLNEPKYDELTRTIYQAYAEKVKDLEAALETEAAKYEVVMWITEDGTEIKAELRLKAGAQAQQEVVKSAADDNTGDNSGAV